jgi:hypothetical protein
MKIMVKIALVTGALALACGSSALAAGQPEGVPPHGKNAKGNGPIYTPGEGTPGPKNGLPDQAKAYGRRCKGESKKHVKGEKGTPFSRCVANLKQAASNEGMAPGRVCKGESKEHVKGERGTAFSRCVKDVVALRKEEREKEKEAAETV